VSSSSDDMSILAERASSSSRGPGWKGSSRDGKVAPCLAYVDSMVAIPEEMMFERALRGVDMGGCLRDVAFVQFTCA
jgi:hypothetical protein